MRRDLGGLIRAGIGIAISVASLGYVLSGVDLAQTADILRTAVPVWIVVSVGLQATDVLLRAARWQQLVAPIQWVRYRPMLAYLLVGYLANNILPARLGELVRSHYLGDREGISRASALGTVVVERIVDTAVVVTIGAVAILVLPSAGWSPARCSSGWRSPGCSSSPLPSGSSPTGCRVPIGSSPSPSAARGSPSSAAGCTRAWPSRAGRGR